MSEKSWKQIREELNMLPRQMCVTPVAEALEYVDEILKLQEQLQSAQQEIEALRQERNKLIEGLRWYAGDQYGSVRFWPPIPDIPILHDCGQRAREILKEIGVTVD